MDSNRTSFNYSELKIDWHSNDSLTLVNPKWPKDVQEDFFRLSQRFSLKGHIWIPSSGSSGKELRNTKLIALSKEAFLSSATAVNHHLKVDKSDRWLNVLPLFHVGGLSILARGFVSDSMTFQLHWPWSPELFVETIQKQQITLTSLVPTQVYDLVQKQIVSPQCLRAVVVGGGSLEKELQIQAQALGWNLLTSFGMTECCSQIATQDLDAQPDSPMKLLSHVTAKVDNQDRLAVKSLALLTGYAQWNEDDSSFTDPKKDGWFWTEDIVKLQGSRLIPQGRISQYIKILGEGVSMQRLESIFEKILVKIDPNQIQKYALVAVPEERKGHELVIVFEGQNLDKAKLIQAEFNLLVLAYEKCMKVQSVDQVPRTELGKLQRDKIVYALKN